MPYIINVAITVVLGLLYNASDKSEENKKRYLIVIWICLSLVAGLRGAYALGDTEGYRSSYLRAASMDFPTFFKTFKIIFVIDCIALAAIILLQEGKSAGLGTISGVADTYWGQNKGRSMEGALVKSTKFLAILFMVLAVVLNMGFLNK